MPAPFSKANFKSLPWVSGLMPSKLSLEKSKLSLSLSGVVKLMPSVSNTAAANLLRNLAEEVLPMVISLEPFSLATAMWCLKCSKDWSLGSTLSLLVRMAKWSVPP